MEIKNRVIKMGVSQVEMVSIEELVPKNHIYRKLKELINFDKLVSSINIAEKELGRVPTI